MGCVYLPSIGIGLDELPIGREGIIIGLAPERELYPNALALDLANRDTAKSVLHASGPKAQAKERAAQALGVIYLQEQAFLTHVTGPESPEVAVPAEDLEG